MTDEGVASLITKMAGAQKLLLPKWLYLAVSRVLGVPPGRTVAQISYVGGALPIEMGEHLPDDVLVIMERSGGLSAAKIERDPRATDPVEPTQGEDNGSYQDTKEFSRE